MAISLHLKSKTGDENLLTNLFYAAFSKRRFSDEVRKDLSLLEKWLLENPVNKNPPKGLPSEGEEICLFRFYPLILKYMIWASSFCANSVRLWEACST